MARPQLSMPTRCYRSVTACHRGRRIRILGTLSPRSFGPGTPRSAFPTSRQRYHGNTPLTIGESEPLRETDRFRAVFTAKTRSKPHKPTGNGRFLFVSRDSTREITGGYLSAATTLTTQVWNDQRHCRHVVCNRRATAGAVAWSSLANKTAHDSASGRMKQPEPFDRGSGRTDTGQ